MLEILKHNILMNYRTGNIVVDMILSSIIIGVFNYMLNNMYYIKKSIGEIMLRNYSNDYTILLIGKTINYNTHTSQKYSNTLVAFLFYLQQNIHNIPNIKSIQELIITDGDFLSDIVHTKHIYELNQLYKFQVNDIISCSCNIIKEELTTKGTRREIIVQYILSSKISLQKIINFLNECETLYLEEQRNKVLSTQKYINYKSISDNEQLFELYCINNTKTFENLFFEQKDMIINQIDNFINNKDSYCKRGLPYKLSFLLSGLPGCGKTSFIKAIANYTKRYIIDISLSKIKTSSEFKQLFFRETFNNIYLPNNKRIYIIEDIDAITDIVKERNTTLNSYEKLDPDNTINDTIDMLQLMQQKNIQETDDKLTLSTILNVFDGIMELTDMIIIITTNYSDKLDSALIRPGRIDINLKLHKSSNIDIINILHNYYQIDTPVNLNIKDYKYTPAEIIQICSQYNNINDCINKL
jgi:ATP-dependent 26S proteasome regulatory subunit